jgi:hypothetical protein
MDQASGVGPALMLGHHEAGEAALRDLAQRITEPDLALGDARDVVGHDGVAGGVAGVTGGMWPVGASHIGLGGFGGGVDVEDVG